MTAELLEKPTVKPEPAPTADAAPAQEAIVAERYGRRDWLVRHLLAGADVGAILLSLLLAGVVSARVHMEPFLLWGVLTLPGWVALFKAYGLYDRDIKRVSHHPLDDFPGLFHGLLLGSVLLWIWFKVGPADQLILVELAVFAPAALVGVTLLRALARRASARALGPERVLMVGEGPTTPLLTRKMKGHPEYGLEPVGEAEGSCEELCTRIEREAIDRVVIAHSDFDEQEMLELIQRCKQLSVKVSLLPQLVDAMGPSVEIDDVQGVTVLGINPPVLPRSSRLLKRALDLTVGGALGVLFAIPIALISLAIRLDSRGPVFFRQERIGRGGRRFRVTKFRTMVEDAERRRDELAEHSIDPNWLHVAHDPRVTRVGAFLRKTSLDELPQLWNVLRGEMSLVGPRPLIPQEDSQVTGWERNRLDLTPGLTGLWQVLGRTTIPFEEMAKLDYVYVTNWSLWTDLRLLMRTVPAVISQRGAN